MPPNLRDCLRQSRQALLADDKDHLQPIIRYQIYCALEPDEDSDPSEPQADWGNVSRRTTLAILATKKVLSIWEDARLGDFLPHKLLAAAESELDNPVSSEVGKNLLIASSQVLDTLWEENQEEAFQRQACVLASANLALRLTHSQTDQFVQMFEANGDNASLITEAEIDGYGADSARWSAFAYAGVPWLATFDRSKSLEFWTWWLDEAVPAAWHVFPD